MIDLKQTIYIVTMGVGFITVILAKPILDFI